MKIIGLVAAVALLIVFAVGAILVVRDSGAPASSDGPAARTEKFERALISGDCPGIKKLVVGPDQLDCAALGEMSQSMTGIDPDSISYKLLDSGGDSATVRVTIDGEKQDLDLVKESGDWLVILDTAA